MHRKDAIRAAASAVGLVLCCAAAAGPASATAAPLASMAPTASAAPLAPAAPVSPVVRTAPETPAALTATAAPLPPSDYTVRAVCGLPAPRHAECMAEQLVPQSAEARARTHPLGIVRSSPPPAGLPAAGDFGLRPQDIHSAYLLPLNGVGPDTIALVDAYNDPTAEADLKGYSEEFGLPECTAGNGCFRQVNQNGEAGNLPFPKTTAELEAARKGTWAQREKAAEATGWGLEISLDIEVAHATCESCRILLVEGNEPSYEDLEKAEKSAVTLGAREVSNSWSGPEEGETPEAESASPFNRPGVVVTAASGDDGYLNWDAESSIERGAVGFPASSPHVVAVGGTRLSLAAGGAWAGETVWNGDHATGGGCSVVFAAPPWQHSLADWTAVGCESKRAVADVAADADPYTGVAVRYTSPECEYTYEEAKVKYVLHWCTIGGTSLASPLIASVFALQGGADGVAYPAATVYENELKAPATLHDVTVGSNGECTKPFLEGGLSACTPTEEAKSCGSKAICLAGTGYDGPTGVGTPKGAAAFKPLPSGCTDYWINNAGGSWFTGADWSTGAPPRAGEGACVIAAGTYTVTMEQTATTGAVSVKSLTVGGKEGAQTLKISGSCTRNAEVAASGTITNNGRGTIAMGASGGCAAGTTLKGTLNNGGTLEVEAAGGGARTITGNVTNTQRVSLAAGATLEVNGSYTETHTGWIRDYIAGPATFGALKASGAVKLEEGALRLFQTAPFKGSLGESFPILTAASLTGKFTVESGAGIGSGLYYKPTYSASGVTLIVTRATLVLSKASGPDGSSVKLTGTGYTPGDTLTPSFTAYGGAKTLFPSVTANAEGDVEAEITIPLLAAEGTGTIGLASADTSVTFTKTFKVT
jgi:Subtilase family